MSVRERLSALVDANSKAAMIKTCADFGIHLNTTQMRSKSSIIECIMKIENNLLHCMMENMLVMVNNKQRIENTVVDGSDSKRRKKSDEDGTTAYLVADFIYRTSNTATTMLGVLRESEGRQIAKVQPGKWAMDWRMARYISAAYVVKLHPKKQSGRILRNQLNSGLIGNVSTFHLNTEEVSALMDDGVLPYHPKVLAATILITFVGPHNIPMHVLRPLAVVNRQRVAAAIHWLIDNNPIYSHIKISEQNLQLLPEDGIPLEVLSNMRWSDDATALQRESAGYVPEGDDESLADHTTGSTCNSEDEDDDLYGKQDGTSSAGDYHVLYTWPPLTDILAVFSMQAHGVIDVEGNNIPTSELMANTMHNMAMEQRGHTDGNNPLRVNVRREDFVNKFWYDLDFVFQVFGVIQKHYQRHKVAINNLSPKDFKTASEEEAKKKPYSNPAVRALVSHLSAVRAGVTGTDQNRASVRSQVWSMIALFNPPSVWITINPSDVNNLVAQESGPDATSRSVTIAKDPYAAVKFFHFMIQAVLESLFGITVHNGCINRKEGIFGKVKAYVGMVESQGKVVPAVGYRCPLNPWGPTYERDVVLQERQLARLLQLHECSIGRCLEHKNGKRVCKNRAPWKIACEDWVNANGEWSMKHLNPYMNGFNPTILETVCCNNDIKLITNSTETQDSVWYFTTYQTKKKKKSNNMTALVAKRMAFHNIQEKSTADNTDVGCRLVTQCATALNRQQEFSASEIISYLMGWNDRYISHHFVPIYLDGISAQLRKTFPDLLQERWQKALAEDGTVVANQTLHDTKNKIELPLRHQNSEQVDLTRQLEDVVAGYQSAAEAWTAFISECNRKYDSFFENIQYFYRSSDQSARKRAEEYKSYAATVDDSCDVEPGSLELEPGTTVAIDLLPVSEREHAYASAAMECAYGSGIFSREYKSDPDLQFMPRCDVIDKIQFEEWEETLAAYVANGGRITDNPLGMAEVNVKDVHIPTLNAAVTQTPTTTTKDTSICEMLNEDQRLAHDIVFNHLQATIEGQQPQQLLMIIRGAGGTGKTAVINAITQSFAAVGQEPLLAKTATSDRRSSQVPECHLVRGFSPVPPSWVKIYHSFTKVVTLTKQMCTKDDRWMLLLDRLRDGDCTEGNMSELTKLRLDIPKNPSVDFDSEGWKDAVLITPRNSSRKLWNAAALRKHCQSMGQRLYSCPADDTSAEQPLTINQQMCAASLKAKDTGNLHHRIELAVGMKAMVMLNIATEAELANGTRGVITGIVSDYCEPALPVVCEGVTMLRFPPAVIFFRLNKGTNIRLEDMEEWILPIVPSHAKFTITDDNVTDYKGQGQTIEYIVVDLAAPTSGPKMTGFSVYVALSRSRGRGNIQLLR
ncbi:hypothetical protein C8J55DRAFT_486060 [Lentinula edodes]|uniref:ATP-dependent DNA helicase n=1 Tax=Lentinula lateritia TaxID=40482 RepID=A0A9W9AYC6_9AGAR|nr:hypothetical protein C8J55DRAFT_486060 [Lentinula edodes]